MDTRLLGYGYPTGTSTTPCLYLGPGRALPTGQTIKARVVTAYDCEYIINGIISGFSLGFTGAECSVRSHNSGSVEVNISSAKATFLQELGLGRMRVLLNLLPLFILNKPR